MIEDFLTLSARNIISRGIRSWLTMLGIFVGIAAIVSLISLGDGLEAAINEQFELLGKDMIYIMPGGMAEMFSGGTTSLNDHDLGVIRDVHGVEQVGGMTTMYTKIKFKDEVTYSFVGGIDPGTQEILLDSSGIEVVRGQKKFRQNDIYKAAVGYEYWIGNVFDRPVRVGDKITLNDKRFEVVGEMSRVGNSEDDKNIYIPMKGAQELFNVKDEYITAIARVRPNYETDQVAEDIEKAMRRDRGLKEGEEDFQVQSLEQMMEATSIVLDAVQWVVIFIAMISLFVGGIGIMNTMYTSVLERTHEIGVIKAVGARNEDILLLFLIESGTIGMIGGSIGCLIGILISKGLEYIAVTVFDVVLLKAAITPGLVIGALAFSFLVGSLSGILPAWQASQLKPVDALRYE
ncbi:MAG: ABC transporter permease [Candidatus Altiarchaeota archaeon]|nr:ABC transporter permease [Candidatus Altiarchaeota archaeon]